MKIEVLKRLILASIIFLLPGCGGGTRGTGSLTIEGRIITNDGQPLADANVTIPQSGDSDTTSADGTFTIITDPITGTPEFLIETPNYSIVSTGGILSSEDEVVSVDITISTGSPPSTSQKITVKKKHQKNNSTDEDINSSQSNAGNGHGDQDFSGDSGPNENGGGAHHHDSHGHDSHGGYDNVQNSDNAGTGADNGNGNSGGEDNGSHDRIEALGPITAIGSSTFVVGSLTFVVTDHTNFGNRHSLSEFAVGDNVDARGSYQDGILVADKVHLKK